MSSTLHVRTPLKHEARVFDLLDGPSDELPSQGWAIISREIMPAAIVKPYDKIPQSLGKTTILRFLQFNKLAFDAAFGSKNGPKSQSIHITVETAGSLAINDTLSSQQAHALNPDNYNRAFGGGKGFAEELDFAALFAGMIGTAVYKLEEPTQGIKGDKTENFLASSQFGTYLAGANNALSHVVSETLLQKGYPNDGSKAIANLIEEYHTHQSPTTVPQGLKISSPSM